jgi:hypothetical protein
MQEQSWGTANQRQKRYKNHVSPARCHASSQNNTSSLKSICQPFKRFFTFNHTLLNFANLVLQSQNEVRLRFYPFSSGRYYLCYASRGPPV